MSDEEKAKKEKAFKAFMKIMLDMPSDSELLEPEGTKLIHKKEEFIQSLITTLSVPQKSFKPEVVIDLIKQHLSENDISERLLYSKITEQLYTAEAATKDTISLNIKKLLNFIVDSLNQNSCHTGQESDNDDNTMRQVEHVALKLYDHILLANFQVQQIRAAVDESKRNVFDAFDEKIEEVEKKVYQNAKDEKAKALLEIGKKMSEESRNSQRGYVSTLGVFAAIMLAAFTSLAIAKDAMPLIANSLSNFVLVFCLVGSFIIILIQMLLNAVFSISDKYEQYKKTFLGHIISYLIILWVISGVSYFCVFL